MRGEGLKTTRDEEENCKVKSFSSGRFLMREKGGEEKATLGKTEKRSWEEKSIFSEKAAEILFFSTAFPFLSLYLSFFFFSFSDYFMAGGKKLLVLGIP